MTEETSGGLPQQAVPYCHIYEYDSPLGLHRALYPKQWNGKLPDRTVPVYTHPSPAPQPVGLTKEQFGIEWHRQTGRIMGGDKALLLEAKRVTERAHGIPAPQATQEKTR